jgi:hypothetical protein
MYCFSIYFISYTHNVLPTLQHPSSVFSHQLMIIPDYPSFENTQCACNFLIVCCKIRLVDRQVCHLFLIIIHQLNLTSTSRMSSSYTSCHKAKIWLSHSQVCPYKECANFDIASLTQLNALNVWMVSFHTHFVRHIRMYYTYNVQSGALKTLPW